MKWGQNGSKWHVFTIFGRFCYSYDQKMHKNNIFATGSVKNQGGPVVG
jgi:hypothetical protein